MSDPIDFNAAKQRKLLEDMILRQQELENIFNDLGVQDLTYLKEILENVEKTLDELKDSDNKTT